MAKKKKGGKESKESEEVKVEEQPTEIKPPEESLATKRIRNNIRDAFKLFDKENENRVIMEDVSTIIRYLGRFPSEDEVSEIILPNMQSDEPDAYITFDKFEPVMLAIVQNNEYLPDGKEVILSAFRALDEEKKGYLDAEYLQGVMGQMGDKFRAKEMEAFFSICKDSASGRIYYEDYALIYAAQIDTNKQYWEEQKLDSEKAGEMVFT